MRLLHRVGLPFLIIALVVFFAFFVILPLAFRFSVTLQRGILFLTFSKFVFDVPNSLF